jgi:hypothetical protein
MLNERRATGRAYWGAGIGSYRVRRTPTLLSVRQGSLGRRVVGLLIAAVGGGCLALAAVDPAETMWAFRRVVGLLPAAGFLAFGVWITRSALPTVAVFDRARDAVVVQHGRGEARAVTRGLADLVGPVVETSDFDDGDRGHRLVLVFRSGERLPLGQDFVGGASAGRAAAAIREFLGGRAGG